MMKRTSRLALPLLAFSAIQANAAVALIDFGRTGNSPVGSPVYNSITDASATALNDTGGSATGWTGTLGVTVAGGGFGTAGAGADVSAFPAAVSSFATSALQDSMFGNLGSLGAAGTVSLTMTLTGLSASFTYDLLLYGSRNNLQFLDQTWTLITGTGTATPVTHNNGNNSTTAVNWTGIVPSAGTIAFTVSGPPATAGAVAINFASITSTPVPETSAALLAGLAVGTLTLRRRR